MKYLKLLFIQLWIVAALLVGVYIGEVRMYNTNADRLGKPAAKVSLADDWSLKNLKTNLDALILKK